MTSDLIPTPAENERPWETLAEALEIGDNARLSEVLDELSAE